MRRYFIWWIERTGGGQWYGPVLLFDEEVWRHEFDVQRGTPGVRHMYRWLWDPATGWQYDDRSASALFVRAGEQKLAAGWP